MGYGLHGIPDPYLKLFNFKYVVPAQGTYSRDDHPHEGSIVIAAHYKEEAQGFFPYPGLVRFLVNIEECEIKPGIIFQ